MLLDLSDVCVTGILMGECLWLQLIRFTPPREITPPPNMERRPSEGVSFEPCVYMQNGMVQKGDGTNGVERRMSQEIQPPQQKQKKRQARAVQKRTPAKPIPPPSDYMPVSNSNSQMAPPQPAEVPRRESVTSSTTLVFKQN